jgi:hypothetical protein
MTPCSPLSFKRCFGGTYRPHLQGRRNRFSKPANKQVESFLAGLLNLFLRPWRWRRYIPPKHRLKLNGLHDVISQKMILFITTAVKTSNLNSLLARMDKKCSTIYWIQKPITVFTSPPLVPVMRQINPAHAFTGYFFKIHFNIILASKPRSPYLYFPFGDSD